MFHDEESLHEKLAQAVAEQEQLLREQRALQAEIEEADRLKEELVSRGKELAQAETLEEAHLACEAQRAMGHRPEADPDSPRSLAFAAGERKLDLGLRIPQLKANMPAVEREAADWEARADDVRQRLERANRKYDAVPWRYRQTAEDVRREILRVLEERRTMEQDLERAADHGNEQVDRVRQEARQCLRSEAEAEAELEQLAEEEEHWERELRLLRARQEPVRERVAKLQAQLTSEFGEAGVTLAAFEGSSSDHDALAPGDVEKAIRVYFAPEESPSRQEIDQALGVMETVSMEQFHKLLESINITIPGST